MEKEIKLEAKIPKEPMILSSKKKWFWIGIITATFNSFAGVIYGVALFREKEYQKEGGMIVGWAIVWFLTLTFILIPFLVKNGYFPQYKSPLPFTKQLPIVK